MSEFASDTTSSQLPPTGENYNPSIKITTSLFNGQNYLAWSQSLTLFLKSKGKMGYVDGRIVDLDLADAKYDQWEITNSQIIVWLIHSMIPDIGESYLSMATTQNVWEAVAATYSRKGNFSQAFELRRAIERSVQGGQSVLQYFTFLSNGWKKLYHLQDYKPVCTIDSIGYKKFIEKKRVFKFLEGLNVDFDPVRSCVLGLETLPSLQEAFVFVQNEESRRSAMMPAVSSDRSALLSALSSEHQLGSSISLSSSSMAQLFCDYCHKPRHTRETCWKLYGIPSRGRGDRSGHRGGRSGQGRGRGSHSFPRAHQVGSTDTSFATASDPLSGITSTELEDVLRRVLGRQSSPTTTDTSQNAFPASLALGGVMEISLLKVLLNNISLCFHLSSHENINHDPARKYYKRIEDILKLLKPVLDTVLQADITFEEPVQKAFAELGHSVNELRVAFENWQLLRSKINFVLQVESSISKLRASGVEIFELLKSSNERLPVELNASSLEIFVQKFKQMRLEETSTIISRTMREQVCGSGPSSESLEKFSDCLGFKSNQELLIEAVALEKLKENSEQAENNEDADYFEQLIALVTHMYEQLVTMKQSESTNPVPIPEDFCCPLSLELMTDPVIVASGQTYERTFIREWIDLGLTVCPKTRQTLAHTNLIPNYTVKALIANWCDTNNVKLPDPTKSMCRNQPSSLAHVENNSRCNRSVSLESAQSTGSSRINLISSSGTHQEQISPSHPRSSSEGSLPSVSENVHGLDIAGFSLKSSEEMTNSIDQSLESGSQSPTSPRTEDFRASGDNGQSSEGHKRSASASSSLSNLNMSQEMLPNGSEVNSLASGELMSETQPATTLTTTHQRETAIPPRLETRTRSQPMWRRPSDRFIPRIVTSSIETRPDLSEVEAQVKNLVEDLKSTSLDAQRNATSELRLLAKHNMDNRIIIASCGAIPLLVDLLRSNDARMQENAVTALLNLSINDNNKTSIANMGAIEPLIHVLKMGSPEAKENSAATLFSLSVIEDNKVRIGRSGAIQPLVDLLGNGTLRGKKDAATALFNLSIFHENKGRIVQAGAVKHLVELMDPAAGMVDKAVAVLANLATIQEGRTAIGQEGGIPVLVEVIELGSARGKENAAAALLQLCTNSNRFCSIVLQEGAVPPLVALSQSGTPRAKEKAQALLSYFRNQRHGIAGRG